MDLFDGGGNKGGRFPLTVLLRFRLARFRVSSGWPTGGAALVCEHPGMAGGLPIMWGVEIGDSWTVSVVGSSYLLGQRLPRRRRSFYFFTLPIYEKITPVDFLAESGNGIGRDLVEDGGYVTVGFFVKDRSIRARDG